MEAILIPILVGLIGAIITIRYKETCRKRARFAEGYAKFAEPLVHFLNAMEDKGTSLNYILLTEFKGHLAAKNIFIRNLKGKRLKRFYQTWTQYEEQYQEVNSFGVSGVGAAIPPNLEALHRAAPDDPKKWEADRKQKIHSIITELLEMAKIKIWF